MVRERLVVRDGRWRSVGCDCCPDEGWLLPEQADVPAVASYVALGHAVLPDRDELARLVEPLAPSEPRHDLALAAIEDWQRRYRAAGGSVTDLPGPPGRRRRFPRRASSPGTGLGVLDGGDPSARQFLVNDSLVAWGGVLNGDIEGYGIEHWLPSLVGPLRDVEVRDALIGWLCPGTVPLDTFPDDLVVMLDVLLGPELRLAPTAGDSAPDSARDSAGASPGLSPGLSARRHGRRRRDGWRRRVAAHRFGSRGAAGPPRAARPRVGDCVRAASLERSPTSRRVTPARPGRAAPDGVRGGETGESWEDWDEATLPRLVLGRLEHVCRLTPAAHAAPLLSVVAALAWWCGDGARAGVAVDHALDLEPDHRLQSAGAPVARPRHPAVPLRVTPPARRPAGASMSWNGSISSGGRLAYGLTRS